MEEETSHSERPHSERSRSPYLHLAAFAVGYGILMMMFPIARTVMITAIIVLVAIWSVLGPGRYLHRLFWAHLIGIVPALGLMFVSILIMTGGLGPSWDLVLAVLVVSISIAPISLAAQIPFWILRGGFGWQLVLKGTAPGLPLGLRDFFAITFAFAFCLAVPQMVAGWVPGLFPGLPGETNSMYQFYGMGTGIVFVGSLLCVPVVLIVFWAKDASTGFAWLAVSAIAGTVVLGIVFAVFVRSVGGIVTSIVFSGIAFGFTWLALSIPLATSRGIGFELVSPQRMAKLAMKDVEREVT